jgi:hypothetical protein
MSLSSLSDVGRKTDQAQFFYSDPNVPNVGKVELSWVNTPLPPIHAASKRHEKEMDSTMGEASNGSAPMSGVATSAQEDYDVAEDDDRWMAE